MSDVEGQEGQSLLMRSSSLGRSVVVQELLELNADMDVINEVQERVVGGGGGDGGAVTGGREHGFDSGCEREV